MRHVVSEVRTTSCRAATTPSATHPNGQRRRTFLGNQHLDRMTTCSCPDAWKVVSALSTESDWTKAPCLRSLRHELTLRRVLCNSDVSVVLPLPVLTRNSVVWRQTAYGSRALGTFGEMLFLHQVFRELLSLGRQCIAQARRALLRNCRVCVFPREPVRLDVVLTGHTAREHVVMHTMI